MDIDLVSAVQGNVRCNVSIGQLSSQFADPGAVKLSYVFMGFYIVVRLYHINSGLIQTEAQTNEMTT